MAGKQQQQRRDCEAEAAFSEDLEAQLQKIQAEDDFGGTIKKLGEYPELKTRELSNFEHDVRDWGLVFGIAFGLAVSMKPKLAYPDAAQAAFGPAYRAYLRWGGPIEDPGVKREAAIHALVRQFEDAKRSAYYGKLPLEMTKELQGAIQELGEWERG
jgi:hypothetical protein